MFEYQSYQNGTEVNHPIKFLFRKVKAISQQIRNNWTSNSNYNYFSVNTKVLIGVYPNTKVVENSTERNGIHQT